MTTQPQGAKPILLAFSGGLDTSFCVPWLAETYGRPIVTVTVDTGGIDAEAAQSARGALADARRRRAPPRRRASGLLRPGAQVPGHGQRAPRQPVSAVRRRRARAAGADRRAVRAQARHRRRRARLDRRRQRPGALRGRAADARAGARDPRAGARPGVQAARAARVPAGAQAAGAAVRRRLLRQSRPVGRDDRRQGDAGLRELHSRRRLGADEGRLHAPARARTAHDRLRGRRAVLARRQAARRR